MMAIRMSPITILRNCQAEILMSWTLCKLNVSEIALLSWLFFVQMSWRTPAKKHRNDNAKNVVKMCKMINSYRILRAMLRQCHTLTYCNPASPGCVLFCQAVPATRFNILKIFADLTAQSSKSSKAKLWTTHLWKCWRSLRNKGLSFRKTCVQHLPLG